MATQSGLAAFQRLDKDMREAGTKALRRRLYAALRTGAEPGIAAARANALATLPAGGGRGRRRTALRKTGTVTVAGKSYVTRRRVAGRLVAGEALNKRVAGAKFKVAVVRGRNPGIRITATLAGRKALDLERVDRGIVRHPLFGNRRYWYSQRVKAGWFTVAMQRNARNVRSLIDQEIDRLRRDLEAGRTPR